MNKNDTRKVDGSRKVGRRALLRDSAVVGTAAIGAAPLFLPLLTGCSKEEKELQCTDVSSLSGADRDLRQTLKYVDKSPESDKNCENCNFFKPAGKDKCGSCTLVKGPIHPMGHCTSWAAKQG